MSAEAHARAAEAKLEHIATGKALYDEVGTVALQAVAHALLAIHHDLVRISIAIPSGLD